MEEYVPHPLSDCMAVVSEGVDVTAINHEEACRQAAGFLRMIANVDEDKEGYAEELSGGIRQFEMRERVISAEVPTGERGIRPGLYHYSLEVINHPSGRSVYIEHSVRLMMLNGDEIKRQFDQLNESVAAASL